MGLTILVGDQLKDVDDKLETALGGEVEVGVGHPTVANLIATTF